MLVWLLAQFKKACGLHATLRKEHSVCNRLFGGLVRAAAGGSVLLLIWYLRYVSFFQRKSAVSVEQN
jgi:hypothetical protein